MVARKRTRRAKPRARDTLPDALLDPACYGRGVKRVRLAETHISWVFLTGAYAYKVKKPIKLPFVDFSTLALRRHFCREELRINRRLAPDLYLKIVPIGRARTPLGSPRRGATLGSPRRGSVPRVGRTPAFEYAVKMREFPADARLDLKLAANRLPRAAVAEFGARLARFHGGLRPVRGIATSEIGRAALRNVDELGGYVGRGQRRPLAELHAWLERRCTRLAATFAQRVADGAHRECHGDLHLQNLLWRDGAIMAFDALEFDRSLRDIDVISETAFLAMDLRAHGRADLAYELLNRYLETTGDYGGLDVLQFYLVHRALVRAKVAAIKRAQSRENGSSGSDGPDHQRYLATALELTARTRPLLVITHGLSGSGKTSVTDELVGRLPALRARSDLERKRLHGLGAAARTHSALGAGLYAGAATRRTYGALADLADRLLRNGQTALIDAAFLEYRERLEFRQVAAANAARFVILDCTAAPNELRRRVTARDRAGSDASEANLAVLEHQLRTHEPLDAAERRAVVRVDTGKPIDYAKLAARLRRS
jgi:aminoglycoside phosphotransferase family enzyme/predicted kinase